VAEVVEGRELLERGEMGMDAVAPPPPAELLVPTSSASAVGRAPKASGSSTDWIRRLNMFCLLWFSVVSSLSGIMRTLFLVLCRSRKKTGSKLLITNTKLKNLIFLLAL
jgi:hypothetical protein